jgi:AAHS family 4-hydroxybenzoate transporter-like MFS transporter
MSFCALFVFGMIVSWLPSVMTGLGLPLRTAILGPVWLNVGGLVGSVVLGLLVDRVGSAVIIGIGLALASVGLLAVGQMIGPADSAFISIFAAGLFLIGALNSINALMAMFYPVRVRATGVGWGLGVGRVGGIIGPVLGGSMLRLAPSRIFVLAAIVAAVGVVAVAAFGSLYPAFRRPASKEPVAT